MNMSIRVGELEADPESKRIIMASFSKNLTLMRRVHGCDRFKRPIPKAQMNSVNRKSHRASSIKHSDIRY